MANVMPSKPPQLYPTGSRELLAFGLRLREARLRRRFATELVAARAGLSRQTLAKIERGNPAVTMGSYLQVLRVLGLEHDLAALAADDEVGRRLQDQGLPRRERAPRRAKPPDDPGPEPRQTD